MTRTLIIGGPKVGKTTYADARGARTGVTVRHTDALVEQGVEWSEASDIVATWFDEPGPWIIEGVAIVRALRKWLATHPEGKPADELILGLFPRIPLDNRQAGMAKAHAKVWNEIRHELAKRGLNAVGFETSRNDAEDAMPEMQTKEATPTRTRVLAKMSPANEYDRTVELLASTPNAVGDQPALTEWDLEDFAKNPVALWAHDQEGKNLPIGTVTEMQVTPEGLKLRVRFASEKANPLAEQLWHCICEGIVRACSVGYELTAPNKARLLEISFVPIGLDPDAGTTDLNPAAEMDGAKEKKRANDWEPMDGDDEEMKKRISSAASALASHRARIVKRMREEQARVDANDSTIEMRMDVASLGKFERTPVGGFKIPARLTRTGVLTYRNPDGSVRKELRLADEIFKADSMATLEGAVVIDIKDHTGMITPESWRRVALGHVANVRRDGEFIVSDLRIDDADAIDAIENGERTEISCGYQCRLEPSPGEYKGERYDFIQRDIRYNHAALCPPNRGRAGPEVGLRLDTANNQTPSWAVARLDLATEEGEEAMNEGAKTVTKIRLDGKEVVEFSKEHVDILNGQIEKFRADAADVSTKLLAETQRADKAEGERDGLKAEIAKFTADAKEEKAKKEADEKEAAEKAKTEARSRRRLERFVLRYFGGMDEEEDEGDEDEEKSKKGKKSVARTDAADDFDTKLDAMDDRGLMLFCIQKVDPKFDGKDAAGKDRSLDYVAARFDAACEQIKRGRSIDGVVNHVENLKRLDAGDGGDVDAEMKEARRKRDEQAANLWRGIPAQNGGK